MPKIIYIFSHTLKAMAQLLDYKQFTPPPPHLASGSIYLALVVIMLGTSHVEAQVTIGGDKPPAKGVILDLNSDTKGGLQLSNVFLDDLTEIPEVLSANRKEDQIKHDLTGAVVYNTNPYVENGNGEGIYVWNGEKWDYYLSGRNIDNLPIRTIIPMPLIVPPELSELNFAIGELGDLQISYRLAGDFGTTLFPILKNNGSTPITITYYAFRLDKNQTQYPYTITRTVDIKEDESENIFQIGINDNHIGLHYRWWIYNPETHRELEFETFQITADKMILKYITKQHPDIIP
ncbi:MAG: hypothetical protein LBQ84_02905 [Flavobacteriaceae bacterium]|jgi:hypothetical protein|nr:hypothetical protein [Flavobacteriaceae bacterium]